MTPAETSHESPFVTIWDTPRETIRYIVSTDPRRHVNLLFFLAGALGGLAVWARLTERLDVPPAAVPVVCAMAGLVAIPLGHVGAWYKCFVGRLLGGQASRPEVVAVAAWSTVPTVVGTALLWAIRFVLYGAEVLRSEHPAIDASPRIVQLTLEIATMLFSAWSLCVSVIGFAEVNRFSIARSIATSLATPILGAALLVAIFVAAVLLRANQ